MFVKYEEGRMKLVDGEDKVQVEARLDDVQPGTVTLAFDEAGVLRIACGVDRCVAEKMFDLVDAIMHDTTYLDLEAQNERLERQLEDCKERLAYYEE